MADLIAIGYPDETTALEAMDEAAGVARAQAEDSGPRYIPSG